MKSETGFTPEERKKLKAKNLRELKRILSPIGERNLELHKHLIEDASAYATNLAEMDKIIEQEGLIEKYQNGENQWGYKKSPSAEMKPKFSSTYQSILKQLTALLDESDQGAVEKELMDFISRT